MVPVTRAAVTSDTSTIQMKLKKVSERKECSTVTEVKVPNNKVSGWLWLLLLTFVVLFTVVFFRGYVGRGYV